MSVSGACLYSADEDTDCVASMIEAEKYVLYLLKELRGDNGHHLFEAVSARLARITVSSNILVATGPVAAGGDQGRDAESFFTRLPDEMPGAAGFIGQASTEPVVVACTLQEDGVPTKIKNDLVSICSQGEPVSHVVYYYVAGVPTAKQHELQAQARTTHDVTLDIFDGQKIATLLAMPKAIWIAQSMLGFPENLLPDWPQEPDTPGWYTSGLAVVRDHEQVLVTHGDATTVARGLRYAATHGLGEDLGDWMRGAERLIAAADGTDVGRNAATRCRYELIYASVRAVGSFSPRVDEHSRALIETGILSEDPGLLDDAVIALAFCIGMWIRRGTALTRQELIEYMDRMRDRVDELIDEVNRDTHPLRHARLVSTAAYIALQVRWDDVEPPPEGTIPSGFEKVEAIRNGTLAVPNLDGLPLDVDEAMTRLAAFADVAPAARGLPIRQLTKLFDQLSPLFIEDHRYVAVRDALDTATAAVSGDVDAGTRARGRAFALRAAGKHLMALREMHNAKARWFHGDTLRGSLLTMVMITRVYLELNLPHAAKQHAMAVVVAAMNAAKPDDVTDLIAPALLLASSSSYEAGAWFDGLQFAGYARMAHALYAEQAIDDDEYSVLEQLQTTEGWVGMAARCFRPELLEPVRRIVEGSGAWELLAAMLYSEEAPWTRERFDQLMCEQLSGLPFSDTGPRRHLRFSALGVSWNIICAQDKEQVLATERLAAALQVVVADLGLQDPVFLPVNVDVEVTTGDLVLGDPVRLRLEDDRTVCDVHLPSYEAGQDTTTFSQGVLSIVANILAKLSALPWDKFMPELEACMKAGLLNRLLIGGPYDSIADMLPEEHYTMLAALPDAQLGDPNATVLTATELEFPAEPGPGYDQDNALKRAQWRYDNLPGMLNQTLPRLTADPQVRAVLADLRSAGWLDWQLLLAVHNLAANLRVRAAGIDPLDPAQEPRARSNFTEPEAATSTPLELGDFTRGAIETQLEVNLLVESRALGLEPHLDAVNTDAIDRLLRERFGYGRDDVAHADVFDNTDAR